MSIVETALVYGGIPVLVIGVLAVLVLGRGGGRPPRYRPGRPWTYEPVWYLPRPIEAGPSRPALTGGSPRAPGAPRTRGGASGTW